MNQNANVTESESFKFKAKITGKTFILKLMIILQLLEQLYTIFFAELLEWYWSIAKLIVC